MSKTFPSDTHILVCDDHPIWHAGLAMVLKKDEFQDVKLSHALTCQNALDIAKKHLPTFAIVDLNLPNESGLDLVKALKEHSSLTKIMVLTASDNPVLLGQALNLKVHALVQKSYSTDRFHEILKHILQRPQTTYVDEAIQALLSNAQQAPLSHREYEVIEHMSKGLTNQEIGELLGCAVATVRTHRARILIKTGAQTTAELIALYLQGKISSYASADA